MNKILVFTTVGNEISELVAVYVETLLLDRDDILIEIIGTHDLDKVQNYNVCSPATVVYDSGKGYEKFEVCGYNQNPKLFITDKLANLREWLLEI